MQTLSLSSETLLKALENIYLTRMSDEKMSKLVRQNKGGTFHMPVTGHETIGTAAALALTPGKDWGLPYYRDRAFAIGLGCDLVDLFAVFLGRQAAHHSGGRMMPDHFTQKDLNIPCQSSCVGTQFLQAVGVAFGAKIKGENDAVYVSAGDGATSQGDFHEALNLACLYELGVIFVIQDNGWAISVPLSEQVAGESIAERSKGYHNLSIEEVDGSDLVASLEAMQRAVSRVREKKGPTLLVAKVPRLCPHSSSDDPKKYQEEDHRAMAQEKDPIPLIESFLLEEKVLTEEKLEQIKQECFDKIEEAAKKADLLPFPDPSTVEDHVFADVPEIEDKVEETGESIVMVDAINCALEEEMERDPGVVVFGEDVAHGKGGVFGATRELTEKFGVARCFNSPLAESTIIGIAIGMSQVPGITPVAEIQFADYLWPGINQLFSELSSIHYRSNAEMNCPVVVRMPTGGYIQGGPYHSQSIESFLAHCPGLKVVIPSDSSDAKRLLKSAIRDPNPVLFLEHKALYRQRVFCAKPEPLGDSLLPLGKARIVREGDDLTFVGWGMMIVMAAELADRLAKEGISVEIIDLRTLVPYDAETVLESVKKTGKLVIAHEASGFGGFGGEISAQITEQAFQYLDAPIKRVTGKNCPVPYSKVLEDAMLPQLSDLEEAIRDLASY